ncbi:hypothetical protein BD410DRAFT_741411 [Rickenella mellea]|uniref:ATP synthase complex subunit H n=1 Tax=Rickenella mellea TaxID=50990 RepID=A0A4Y7QJF1_9AGAM|nr:hypothetical protein BD410DRAFT_741411 [Rickenella mellea]
MSMLLRRSAQLARVSARTTVARSFSTSPVTQKDLVQELYLNELKAYKAPPPAKDAHVGAVKNINIPHPPEAPAPPTNLAAELSAYDATEPSLAPAPSAKGAVVADEMGTGAKSFLNFLEQDLPRPEAHH